MALSLSVIDKPIGPIRRTYKWQDVVLYALGIGSGSNELEFCYEKDLKVIPTFATAAIMDFFWEVGAVAEVNPAGVLHGEQQLIFHKPIPGSGSLSTEGRITHIYDKGAKKGALILAESETVDDDGQPLFTSIITIFCRLDGGFGGPASPKQSFAFPDRGPDCVVEEIPGVDQPLLYRLSGDLFPLHVDPEFARLAGFERPIMHGLCTHGFACRALMGHLIPGHPEKARRIDCRFSRPLYPGTAIRTEIWEKETGVALWRTCNAQNGETVIDRGVFIYED